MRCLLLSHILPPAVDGGSRVIDKIGHYLQKNDCQVLRLSSNCYSSDDFVTPCAATIGQSSPKSIRLPVYRRCRRTLKAIRLTISKLTGQNYLTDLLTIAEKGPLFQFLPFISAYRKIKRFGPDLIIAGPLPTTIVLYAYLLKKRLKIPLIINTSLHPQDPGFNKIPFVSILKQSDLIWTLSQSENDFLTRQFKLNPKKLLLLGNGVDKSLLINPAKITFPQNPTLLFIGSLSAHKGLELLIKSFIHLKKNHPLLKLVIAGQKTLHYPKIKKLFDSLPPKIKSDVKLIFKFPDRKLPQIIDQSTILILPSFQESFGLVLIEAMARGKPVIASDLPPLKELVDRSRGGFCFKKTSMSDLTRTINHLLSHPALCQSMGLNGYNFVRRHHTWDRIGECLWPKLLSLVS